MSDERIERVREGLTCTGRGLHPEALAALISLQQELERLRGFVEGVNPGNKEYIRLRLIEEAAKAALDWWENEPPGDVERDCFDLLRAALDSQEVKG